MPNNEHISGLIDDASQALLSAIGNHEAKSLAAVVINSQPNSSFSVRQLEREMVSRQGDRPAWAINSGTLADYCTDTLFPIGAVAREDKKHGSRTGRVYSASEFGMERGLPFAGAILEWSLMYPNNSVQKLLGITAVAGESIRSPIMSFLIMQELVTNLGDAEISMGSIGRSLGQGIEESRVVGEHLRRLEGEKLVEVRTVVQDYNPIYKIDRDKANNIALTHDTSLAIRNTWLDSPGDEMTLGELLKAVSLRYPDLAQSEVRRVMGCVMPRQRLPFLEVTGRNGTPINHSVVGLTPDGRKLMDDFVEMVEASAQDEQHEFRKFAVGVISDEDKFGRLMDKAKKSSNSATKSLDRTVILDEIKLSGKMTVSEVREALALKGLNVGSASVRKYLSAMVEEKLIEPELSPLSESLKRKAVHYRVAE